MSGINRLLSRRDRHRKDPKDPKETKETRQEKGSGEKVMSSSILPLQPPPPTVSSSSSSLRTFSGVSTVFSPPFRQSSSSSLSSLSLAFAHPKPKGSPRSEATQPTVHSSTANTSDFYLLQPRQTAGHLHGLFTDFEEKIPEKDEEVKIKALSKRLSSIGITHFKEPDLQYALNAMSTNGDPEKAFDLLVLLEESEEGIIKEYNPNIKLLGAVNRNGVTCYLDATLFAMFARLDSFEAILYNTFQDAKKKRLATLLRFWVNTLRVGKLITVDITKQLQEALADCGWKEAAEKCQQDASEAFSFITEKLELPMLTLKMDIFHTGKEDANDDHKFVQERLLDVAIPEEPTDGRLITLEDCLETYFNNRVEVKRYLERRATLNSMRIRASVDSGKANALHVETVRIDDSQPASPAVNLPQSPLPMYSPATPVDPRHRAPSLIQDYHFYDKSEEAGMSPLEETSNPMSRPRASSVRKEVMMPAWQFFSLIPWYTDDLPSTDAQVAAHFSSKRPVLGICLKRYSMLPNGQAVRRGTKVDIPLEIGLPHFIHDDNMSDDGAAFGNFKLSLQSVVCHRGNSVDQGHYVSLVRGQAPNAVDGEQEAFPMDSWMLFDDLARERIRYVDIKQALMDESPYLLFYQVQPIDGDPGNIESGDKPPSYNSDGRDPGIAGLSAMSTTVTNGSDENIPSQTLQERRGRLSVTSGDARRISIALTDASNTSAGKTDDYTQRDPSTASAISIPGSATTNPLDSSTIPSVPDSAVITRRGSKLSKTEPKSRGVSVHGDSKRLSTSFTRLAGLLTKDRPETVGVINAVDPNEPPKTVPLEAVVARLEAHDRAEKEKSRLKKEKRGRSRGRGGNGSVYPGDKGKSKVEKPERECVVM
ncbi:MAG: hypothetical protein MMC33_001071 [Icmadophila ericetorum]|nr:hypothetical protein [Icmadophila ericetorum]